MYARGIGEVAGDAVLGGNGEDITTSADEGTLAIGADFEVGDIVPDADQAAPYGIGDEVRASAAGTKGAGRVGPSGHGETAKSASEGHRVTASSEGVNNRREVENRKATS